MTDQHPITPPPELVKKWVAMLEYCEDIDVFTDVVRWGADTELEACCEWLLEHGYDLATQELHYARRPKPQSLKEQALALIDGCNDPHGDYLDDAALDTIRRALEALPDA